MPIAPIKNPSAPQNAPYVINALSGILSLPLPSRESKRPKPVRRETESPKTMAAKMS